jgi:outer membrane protein
MKYFFNKIIYLLIFIAIGIPADAVAAGDKAKTKYDKSWMVRVRGINYHPRENGDSKPFQTGGISLARTGVRMDNDILPEVNLVYRFHRRLSIEGTMSITRHDVSIRGSTLGLSHGDTLSEPLLLSPEFTLQYHLRPFGPVEPYLGVGVNYTTFTDEDPSPQVQQALGAQTEVEFDDDVALVLQAGLNVPIKENLSINLDLRYIDSETAINLEPAGAVPVKSEFQIQPVIVGVGLGWKF